jgi:uncharacterized protein
LFMFVIEMLILGLGVGLLSAALGLGGGVLMVPAFITFLHMEPHVAKGASLLVIVFVAASNAWRLMRGVPGKPWRLAGELAAGSILGGYASAWAASSLSSKALIWVFIAFLLLTAVRVFFIEPPEVRAPDMRKRQATAFLIGLATGIVSGMTGIGGGTVLVPLVLWAGLEVNERVAGLSNMVMVATCAAAVLAQLSGPERPNTSGLPWTVGEVNLAVPPLVFIGAQMASPIGKRINDMLTIKRRRFVMGVILLLITAQLIYRQFA